MKPLAILNFLEYLIANNTLSLTGEKLIKGGGADIGYPATFLLPLHILRPAGLLFPSFLQQDTVNALSNFPGFFHFLFQRKIPLIERFLLGGQLVVFCFPCLCRYCGLAVHHAFKIIFCRRNQDLLGFGLLIPVSGGNGFTLVLPLFVIMRPRVPRVHFSKIDCYINKNGA